MDQLTFPIDPSKLVAPFRFPASSHEYRVVALHEATPYTESPLVESPALAHEYWQKTVRFNPYFDPERECFGVILVNVRRRAKGHQLISHGTLDTILVHPSTIFRLACITSTAGVILFHNHPSGDPAPSEADIKVTRDLIRAGQLLKVEVVDHIVIGNGDPGFVSLRELGYFNGF